MPVTADFSYTPSIVIEDQAVQFTDLSSTPSPATITAWLWTFGDGTTSTQQHPAKTWANPGLFNVTLRATNSSAEFAEKTAMIAVNAQPPAPALVPPVADFLANFQSGDAPLTVRFVNRSTGKINAYAWSFGDGGTSNDKNPEHVFEYPGTYVASLTVYNEAGNSIYTFRIDITAPAVTVEPDRAETANDLIPSIRAAMRRPSEQKLRYNDILDVLNDLLRGYSRDLHVSEQDHRTDEAQCGLNHIDGSDYILTLQNVAEIEAMELKYLSEKDLQTSPERQVWREVTIVPLDYYSERAIRDYAVCSFYGGMIVDNGVKVKLNLDKKTVEESIWKVRFRMPILKLLTLSAKTPLPADFLPMLKAEAVMKCLQRVRDDSQEWYSWRRANEPIIVAEIADWRGRWDDFLKTNVEPRYVPKIAANDYRRIRGYQRRYTIERAS